MDVAYEGNAAGGRRPIQFHKSMSPPEFPSIQGVVTIMINESPRLIGTAIYTGGSFPRRRFDGAGELILSDAAAYYL